MPLDALNVLQGPAGAKSEVYSDWPAELITGTRASPKPRLRVDVGQTAFFEGRQFRTFHEFNIASGNSLWARFTSPVDLIVVHRSITVLQGNLRYAICSSGTASGSWTAKTVYPVNAMSERPAPVYTTQVVAEFGGTVTGATEVDLAVLETGTSQAVSVQSVADEAGLAAGTYYIEIRNTGGNALRGLYSVVWEERQPPSSAIT